MFDPTPDEIRDYWQGEGANVDRRGPCPHPNHRNADGPNFQVSLESGFATCYSKCDKTWSMLEWEIEVHGETIDEAWDAIYRKIGRTGAAPAWPFEFPPPKGVLPRSIRFLADHILRTEHEKNVRAIALHQYCETDSNGLQASICLKVRFQGSNNNKIFRWWALTDRGGWSSPKKLNIFVGLYRSQEWKNEAEVHLLNGEKAVDRAVREWGLGAITCLPHGEGKWRDEYLAAFEGVKRVFIVPHNDAVGRRGALLVALDFIARHFLIMGHRDLLVTRSYRSPIPNAPHRHAKRLP